MNCKNCRYFHNGLILRQVCKKYKMIVADDSLDTYCEGYEKKGE